MNPTIVHGLGRAAVITCIAVSVSGCYYMQAVRGQVEIMRKREPIAEVIDAAGTSSDLAARLRIMERARRFSIDELGLPDNDSYRSYADLERDFVVWNVIAAPEFSLQARRWCYPVVGCVNYRGYFSEEAAQRKADRLAADGYDIAFGGIAAYSTLGRFSDPILNTMMHWEDTDLVALMFHELAHQVLYVRDDSGFNESFATAVEEFGIERWLAEEVRDDKLADYQDRRTLRQEMMRSVDAARNDLDAIYSSDMTDDEMRHQKQQRLRRLSVEVKALFTAHHREAPTWLDDNLNNARLASMTLYHGRLPEFRALMAECDDDIHCFYARAAELAESSK